MYLHKIFKNATVGNDIDVADQSCHFSSITVTAGKCFMKWQKYLQGLKWKM